MALLIAACASQQPRPLAPAPSPRSAALPKPVPTEQQLNARLTKNSNDVEALLALARLTERKGSLDEAAALYQRAHEASPQDGRPIVGLASIERKRGYPDKTMELVVEALARDLNNVSAWNQLGLVLYERTNYPSAVLVFNKGLKIDDKRADLYSNRGLAEIGAGHIGEAARDFSKAVELDPNLVAARLNLGAIFLDNLDFSGAEQHFAAVLAQEPANADALLGHGRARFGQKDPKGAASDYEKVLSLRSDDHRALYDLARVALDLEDTSRALDLYRRLLALSPGDEEVARAVKRLEGMAR